MNAIAAKTAFRDTLVATERTLKFVRPQVQKHRNNEDAARHIMVCVDNTTNAQAVYDTALAWATDEDQLTIVTVEDDEANAQAIAEHYGKACEARPRTTFAVVPKQPGVRPGKLILDHAEQIGAHVIAIGGIKFARPGMSIDLGPDGKPVIKIGNISEYVVKNSTVTSLVVQRPA